MIASSRKKNKIAPRGLEAFFRVLAVLQNALKIVFKVLDFFFGKALVKKRILLVGDFGNFSLEYFVLACSANERGALVVRAWKAANKAVALQAVDDSGKRGLVQACFFHQFFYGNFVFVPQGKDHPAPRAGKGFQSVAAQHSMPNALAHLVYLRDKSSAFRPSVFHSPSPCPLSLRRNSQAGQNCGFPNCPSSACILK